MMLSWIWHLLIIHLKSLQLKRSQCQKIACFPQRKVKGKVSQIHLFRLAVFPDIKRPFRNFILKWWRTYPKRQISTCRYNCIRPCVKFAVGNVLWIYKCDFYRSSRSISKSPTLVCVLQTQGKHLGVYFASPLDHMPQWYLVLQILSTIGMEVPTAWLSDASQQQTIRSLTLLSGLCWINGSIHELWRGEIWWVSCGWDQLDVKQKPRQLCRSQSYPANGCEDSC